MIPRAETTGMLFQKKFICKDKHFPSCLLGYFLFRVLKCSYDVMEIFKPLYVRWDLFSKVCREKGDKLIVAVFEGNQHFMTEALGYFGGEPCFLIGFAKRGFLLTLAGFGMPLWKTVKIAVLRSDEHIINFAVPYRVGNSTA